VGKVECKTVKGPVGGAFQYKYLLIIFTQHLMGSGGIKIALMAQLLWGRASEASDFGA
jgi:hypothetical protein